MQVHAEAMQRLAETMQALAEELLAAPGFVAFEFPLTCKAADRYAGEVELDAHCARPYYCETVRLGAHVVHSFRFQGAATLDFLLARFAAWQALWARDLDPLFGVFERSFEQRLRAAFDAPDAAKGIAECAVCHERTALKTNCVHAGRKNPHPLCAACLARVGKCPYSCLGTLYDAVDDMDDPPLPLRCDCCLPFAAD